MATNFPTSIDTNPGDPTPSETLAAGGHANLHTFVQDAIIAIETYLGATASAVTTSITYLLTNVLSIDPGHKHSTASISGQVAVGQGGTGLSSTAKGSLPTGTGAAAMANTAVGTDGQVLSADSTQTTGLKWIGNPMPTGGVFPYAGTSAPTGFLICDGSAVSRTTYAALFAIISTTFGAGDGSTTFNLPDLRSRAVIGVGTGTKVFTFASRSGNTITVTGATGSTTNELQTGEIVNYVSTGSAITGLTSTNNYYIIRISNTSFQLASSLANAQNGTAIALSSNGSGTQTFTETLTARALADTGGEEMHAMSATELLSHTHNYFTTNPSGNGLTTASANSTSINSGIQPTGGNAAMNVMNPFLALNFIIKT